MFYGKKCLYKKSKKRGGFLHFIAQKILNIAKCHKKEKVSGEVQITLAKFQICCVVAYCTECQKQNMFILPIMTI